VHQETKPTDTRTDTGKIALAELAALGVAFISLRDNLDLSTPSGRLMFQIIGAMAEFERALIQERVRAGIRNAQAKGKRLGRPRVVVDALRIATLRTRGDSWSQIQAQLGERLPFNGAKWRGQSGQMRWLANYNKVLTINPSLLLSRSGQRLGWHPLQREAAYRSKCPL
jgi:hypothetical protein